MKWIKTVLIVQMSFALAWSAPRAWSQQEEDFDLDAEIQSSEAAESDDFGGDDFSSDEGIQTKAAGQNSKPAEDDVSFDDFAEEGEKKAQQTQPTENLTDEMTLEPLEGDEDQVTDVPESPKTEEPTPEEFTPPPPVVAEPSPTPTPEPGLEQNDEPDLAFEAKLHDIYINYNSKRLSPQQWSQLLGSRDSETYTIQRGDTLWNISKTFFSDGNYWPKIWQLNSRITNPHLIEPGNTIRFLLGTESETPAFAVTENAEEPVEMPVGDAGAAGLEMEEPPKPKIAKGKKVEGTPSDEVEIPPPSEEFRPVLKRIPPSLPEWFLQRRGDAYDQSGIDYGRRPIVDLPDKKYLESFVDEEEFKADGEVSEIEGGARTASNFQYVFLKLPAGKGSKGAHFTVIRKRGQLPRVSKEVATAASELGWQYQYQGQVRLEDKLSTTADGQDIYRALVTKSIGQIEKNSLVIHGDLPTLSLKSNGPKSDVMTQIVGAHQIDNQKTLSLHSLAYLSGGAAEGLSDGQILTVRANTRVRNSESIIAESYIPVGLLKVVRVGQRFSTAIVLKVWDAIFVGDVTGAGKVLPPEPPERRKDKGKTTASRTETFDDSDVEFTDDGGFEDDDSGGGEESLEDELDGI